MKRWGLAVAAILGIALPLYAHTQLESSVPAKDAIVAVAPAELRLTFNERVDPDLSEVRLVVDGGAGRVLQELEQGAAPVELIAPVPAGVSAGEWTVHWRVAGADGHPVRGSYAFRVEAPLPVPAEAAAPPDSPSQVIPLEEEEPMSVGSPTFVAARWITFTAMLTVIGAVAFRYLVLHPARMRAPVLAGAMDAAALGAARLGRGAALFLALAAAVRLLLQLETMGGADASLLGNLLFASTWGIAWFVQVATALGALLGFHLVIAGRMSGWTVAAIAAVGIALGSSLASHAAALDLATLGVTADALHTLAVSGWLGALLVMVGVGIPAVLREDPRSGKFSAAAALVTSFSPRALLMAAIAAITGTFGALLHFPNVASLWQTAYGQTLLVKLALVAAAAGVGAWNWRRMKPRLDEGEPPERLRRSAAAELFVGALVLLATAVLVALPTP